MGRAFDHDVIIAGGGLAGGLIALRLRAFRPSLDILVLEAGPVLGGVHTWSCFESDLTAEIRDWLTPMISHRWAGYSVRFPGYERRLTTPYLSIASSRFADHVMRELGAAVRLNAPVADLEASIAMLADGTTLTAPLIIDARGPTSGPLVLGWQKFVGLEVELSRPHDLAGPIVMDATVDQLDGYRFLYTLPLSPTRLLIEDTRYSDGEALDKESLRADIGAYAEQQGWSIASIIRQEDGVLPIALGGDIAAWWDRSGSAVSVGLRAALFHPVTGYSLPDAARLADEIAVLPRLDTAAVRAAVRQRSMTSWEQRGFFRLLNRMLFRACAPELRYRVLGRFYRLRQPLVERFYAARPTLADKARILTGKPPVPIGAAIKVMAESSVLGDLPR
ncbi:lycopene beta-cyclase CrtY [Caulobacter sp. NIBR1757]|uniref:lycopene beta-cyclase CrtY n=1 Tax=Caulobacter sp. NIBR1757 TaxID=3016000 RepID=UPI0022F1294F|nr:lycopene beta-cyclase CrtY [Caulobacter sp. NIBR1757]WGM38627.1 Lycopene beta-cyclase [Caulobacter sp. NIBR1757]